MIFTHLLTPLFALVLTCAPVLVNAQAQIVYDAEHNATVIVGTWSSGSQHVLTGAGFANPANQSFTYPKTTGVSYSFTADGYYEIARYRFNGNGSQPTCITGVINWVHGTYTLEPNGSIVLVAMADGYQQIQDPCAAVSNFVETYNLTELYQSWRIFQDTTLPPPTNFKLHLFQYDGSPLAPQFLVSTTPNMLPTQLLRNVTKQPTTTTTNGLTNQNAIAITGAAQRRWSPRDALGAAVGTFAVGLVGLVL